jgi:hypothetical protein
MDKEQLQNLQLALEGVIEQLTHAQAHAISGSEIGAPPSHEVQVIERSLGELTALRNEVREKLMKLMARPSLNVLK